MMKLTSIPKTLNTNSYLYQITYIQCKTSPLTSSQNNKHQELLTPSSAKTDTHKAAITPAMYCARTPRSGCRGARGQLPGSRAVAYITPRKADVQPLVGMLSRSHFIEPRLELREFSRDYLLLGGQSGQLIIFCVLQTKSVTVIFYVIEMK